MIGFQQIFEGTRFITTMALHDGFKMTRDVDKAGLAREKSSNQLFVGGVQTCGHRAPGL